MALRDLKLEVAPVEATSLASETPAKGGREISLDGRVAICPAGHGDGADSVEFVAYGLPFLPFEEFGERHGIAQGEVDGSLCYRADLAADGWSAFDSGSKTIPS